MIGSIFDNEEDKLQSLFGMAWAGTRILSGKKIKNKNLFEDKNLIFDRN